ncbi:hypothetical protein [Corallococcus macrosporus]|uniref:hypothetical protein n=1 Tax=Corallococcus macrosporus TaxID=35 RepID=UPI0002E94582|nr:hypothetical protein [Corallococcus macrosporus]
MPQRNPDREEDGGRLLPVKQVHQRFATLRREGGLPSSELAQDVGAAPPRLRGGGAKKLDGRVQHLARPPEVQRPDCVPGARIIFVSLQCNLDERLGALRFELSQLPLRPSRVPTASVLQKTGPRNRSPG